MISVTLGDNMLDKSDIEFVMPNGLRAMMCLRSDSQIFPAFFEAYDKAFVLPNEKEEMGGFEAALALNWEPDYSALAKQYGPFTELCLLAFDEGHPIGGINMFATTTSSNIGHVGMTANLNYIFVLQEFRGRGYMRQLLNVAAQALREISCLLGGGTGSALIFVEQNDPFRLSAEQYRTDSQVSGIDQFERLYVWARSGARFIDFPYVQPALSVAQGADDTLVYSVLGYGRVELDAKLLRQHLERFFAISVLKGAPLHNDASAMSQLAELDRMLQRREIIGVCDLHDWLKERLRHTDRFSGWQQRPRSLLEAAGAYRADSKPRTSG